MRAVIVIALLASATPAFAAGTAVTEPSGLVLFSLGVLGVIVGRQSSRRKRD